MRTRSTSGMCLLPLVAAALLSAWAVLPGAVAVAADGSAPPAAEHVKQDDASVVGTWKLTYSPGDADHVAAMTVTKDGAGLKADFKDGDQKSDVTRIEFKDGKLTFVTQTERDGDPATATFEAKLNGDSFEGSADWTFQGMNGSIAFEGKRESVKPEAGVASVEAVPGKPNLLFGNFDLAPLGYQLDEFFVSGTASSYKLSGEATPDGKWDVVSADTAPYMTRIVVARPTDPKKFSGTAVVEWMNVSGGMDAPVSWIMAHREMTRRGHAFVGVSAQKVGIEGGQGLIGAMAKPLKKADPQRYGRLSHPGDAYSFDIFSQAGRLVKDSAASKVLGELRPEHVIAVGESQSAFYLTTYATAIDPVAKVYDGILIHSRAAAGAPLDGGSMLTMLLRPAYTTHLRPDLRVPVLTVITETDLVVLGGLTGYHAARQPDTDRLHVWEIAGTAHADNYSFTVGFIDSGSAPAETLAAAYAPTATVIVGQLDKPMNFGPTQHYVIQAALWQLDRWVKTGQAPPKAAPLKLEDGKASKLAVDANGLAEGGIRTPWVDVPTARLSGVGNSGSIVAALVGVGEPFDAATLQRLYPGGKPDYLKKFEASLDKSIEAGFILPDEKAEVMALAVYGFPSPNTSR